MAIKSNLYIDQGTTYTVVVDVVDANGSVLDLTNYTANAQIRKYYYSNSYIAFDTTVGDGTVTISLSAEQTANIANGRYLYDVIVTSNSGIVTRVVEGIATVNPRVTR